MSELLQLQMAFAGNVALLLLYAKAKGYEVTLGEVWRHSSAVDFMVSQGLGTRNTLHADRLAIDINLFRDGRYLALSQDHAEIGAFWKSLHPLNRWGGDFGKPDGNHYSMEYRGRK